jgi:hypothetical protein
VIWGLNRGSKNGFLNVQKQSLADMELADVPTTLEQLMNIVIFKVRDIIAVIVMKMKVRILTNLPQIFEKEVGSGRVVCLHRMFMALMTVILASHQP